MVSTDLRPPGARLVHVGSVELNQGGVLHAVQSIQLADEADECGGAVSYSALGWVLGRQLSFSGQLGLASQHASQTGKLYYHVNKDTADHIVTAFRFGTFY